MSIVEWDVKEGGIALVTIDRPERRNALSGNTLAALHRTFDAIAARPEIRAVVLTGAGVSFCSGADMKATAEDMDDLAGSATGDAGIESASSPTVPGEDLADNPGLSNDAGDFGVQAADDNTRQEDKA